MVMKKNTNVFSLVLLLSSCFLLQSCYEQPDLISEISTSVGKVAQVSVVWLGTTRQVSSSSAVLPNQTVDAGDTTIFNIEFTSEIPVKEFRVYWAATATGTQTLISTLPSGAEKYDPVLRSYVFKVPVQAPDTKGATRIFFAEIITDNGLASLRKSATLTTNK
jgi:uncharacterized lipoprotein YajG